MMMMIMVTMGKLMMIIITADNNKNGYDDCDNDDGHENLPVGWQFPHFPLYLRVVEHHSAV